MPKSDESTARKQELKSEKKLKNWKEKKRISSEVSVKVLRTQGVSHEEKNEGCGGKDLQKGRF